MASFAYNSFWDDLARGAINPAVDDFKLVLVAPGGYAEDKDAHTKRSSITGEIAASAAHPAGGVACPVSITKDLGTNQVRLTFGPVNFPNATITAAKAVIYKARGGAASADELVAVDDFGGTVSSTAPVAFSVAASTITIQN